MKKTNTYIPVAAAMILFMITSLGASAKDTRLDSAPFRILTDSIQSYVSAKANVKGNIRINKVILTNELLTVDFSKTLEEYPFRNIDISEIYRMAKDNIPAKYSSCNLRLTCNGREISELVSDFYSGNKSRYQHKSEDRTWITHQDRKFGTEKGLKNKNIALWSSHGYYYEKEMDRWEWQRAGILQTVEDRFTRSIVNPFLVPMLENAGATVLMPSERDPMPDEICMDADSPYFSRISGKKGQEYCWRPNFPYSSEYNVYVRYRNVPSGKKKKTRYEIHHSAGKEYIDVDQSMGEDTWLYLGRYNFDKGENSQGLSIADPGTSDIMVKFGGGTGESGMPRFEEASRYYLKWAGFPESVYAPDEKKSDYRDDFMSRGLWVNELIRRGIPVDMALGLHSDAGTTPDESTIGTLAIYSSVSKDLKTKKDRKTYPDGNPRFSSRELADIIQSQIVNDIRGTLNPEWSRRGLWDKRYFEAYTPDVPTVLVELLSHQNYADMLYGHDPVFKFTVARAIYKGILRYLTFNSGKRDYIVQPLPVSGFSIQFHEGKASSGKVRLAWTPVNDPLESTAVPDKYLIYVRTNAAADQYDDTQYGLYPSGEFRYLCSTDDTSIEIEQKPGIIYSYRIIAANEGGISFPSETLSAYISPNGDEAGKALIINGFTRLSVPASISSADSTLIGFDNFMDSGVPYGHDLSYFGPQYNFRRPDQWINDDEPGYGASARSYHHTSVAGNTFDFTISHAIALAQCGFSVVSSSLGAIMENPESCNGYQIMDVMTGKQVTTVSGVTAHRTEKYETLPIGLRSVMARQLKKGGTLLVSGSYLTTDSWDSIFPQKKVSSSVPELESIGKDLARIAEELSDIQKNTLSESAGIRETLDRYGYSLKDHKEDGTENIGNFLDKDISALNEIISGFDRKTKQLKKAESLYDNKRLGKEFITDNLGIKHLTKKGSFSGAVEPAHKTAMADGQEHPEIFEFNTRPNPYRYSVESPCGFVPAAKEAEVLFRYADTGIPAVVKYGNAISAGFPIEALKSQAQINELFRILLGMNY